MNEKIDKLKKLFNELNELNPTKYKALLKRLCEELKISYKDDEDLKSLLNKLLDKVCSSGCSEIYNKVLNEVNNEIMLIEVFSKLVEELDNKKNNDQGLTL